MSIAVHQGSALPSSAVDNSFAPGFANPVFDSQHVFRMVLDAMAHPGSVRDIATALEAPGLLQPASAAVFLALADLDTPVWIQPGAVGAEHATTARFLGFHCGCPLRHDAATAAFALIHSPERMPALSSFRLGDAEYPDRSATLLIHVQSFEGAARVQLTGPGINGRQALAVSGLPADFWNEWRENNLLFPRGVDVLFICGTRVVALPRTTRVEA